ncbi:protease modulator HflC [Aerophototrophica crusticola]|uniref:Protein HflC n=1 Tax=Aerophototrophica crusticola TaxID=1709002 RepID=A0A858R8K9_9PROT|nr:protease modulator HflC [Rhodospirillaceae bacterium B3]
MNRKLSVLGVVILAALVIFSGAFFTLAQTQQALVLQFGSIQRVVTEPGLKFKIPFIQDVVYLEKRVLDVSPENLQVLLADQKRLEVDAFARYRIKDPQQFYQSARTEQNAASQLSSYVNSALRRVLGSVTLLAVLSDERARIMDQIKSQVNQEAQRLGVEIVDVRIRRADLPEATSQAVYERMRSERVREAAEARAQGQEQAQQIRSRAERERTVILAESQRDSQILRGEGDNQAIRILSEAGTKNPEFYQFYRSLEAYRAALKQDNTTMVLSPDSEFFRYFDSMGALKPPAPGPRAAAPGQ